MIDIIDVKYEQLSKEKSDELFGLRKMVFKDRLNWAVTCINDIEFDEYDNNHTTYLFGIHNNTVICSLRLIEMQYPNMIENTFSSFFNDANIPKGKYIESSRFFVDKTRAKEFNFTRYPISAMLFLAALNYSKKNGYDGILTLVSQSMLKIMARTGWQLSIVGEGVSEKNENVYILKLPNDNENQKILIENINQRINFTKEKLTEWPLSFNVAKN
jgi:acyl homoserine lactone synthase